MKRFLAIFSVLAVLTLLALPADAGWNLRQKSDGTAEWVNSKKETHALGTVILNLNLANVSTASSASVAVPLTSYKVFRVISSLQGQITTAAAEIGIFRINDTATTIVEITNGTTRMSIPSESITGSSDIFTPIWSSAASKITNAVNGAQSIFVETDGSSTQAVGANFTIILVPKR